MTFSNYFHTFLISGSKECFDEPINLRKKIHTALGKENQEQNLNKNETTATEKESDHNAKEDNGNSVKKRDKV